MPATRSYLRHRLGWAGLLVVAATVCGCGSEEFEDRTARVTVDGRTTTYELDSCGLDGTTLFLVGRSTGGSVVQAVVGLEDDAETGVPASTGLTVGDAGSELAGFGAESWERRGEQGRAPGRITRAALRGSRIQVEGRVEAVDAQGVPPVIAGAAVDVALDARCDEPSD
ncbi:MAG TPA: hypothetical protein VHK88_16155 [Aquihabitans sp.]|nr:hypothetical protein [Aquihabitans sp.]